MFRHLYLHVPFCRRRCSYCDFPIAVRGRVPSEEYLEAIRQELAWRRDRGLETGEPLETLYLGGGTPSLLPPESLVVLLEALRAVWTLSPHAEVTLEANPEDVTVTAATTWRQAGVNRISLGVQSFEPSVLLWMRRPHGADAPARAFQRLRDAGFRRISLDLIFAVPESLRRDWRHDLERAVALAPEHVSLYGLTVEPRTPFARWLARGETRRASDESYAAEYLLAHRVLGDAGYEFYEVSNAAREAGFSRHNAGYWLGEAYLGLGPAAHGYEGEERFWNVEAWEAYRAAVRQGRSPEGGRERIDAEGRRLEATYLALRTTNGLPLERLDPARVERWCREGWAAVRGGRVVLSPEGWLLLDELVLDLTP